VPRPTGGRGRRGEREGEEGEEVVTGVEGWVREVWCVRMRAWRR
jgi:hypothetical protein